jgi:hypothetical protein
VTSPAPEMDGFDLRGLRSGRIYAVDVQVARYLVFSGYAESVDVLTPPRTS